MLAIDALLRLATCSPVDTIVHVGAGSGAVLDRYVHLSPSKVVLVEGDPEAAAALRCAARPFPWAQVVAQASAREDGELVWNRYNLPMLNGPVAADVLTSRYPRLRRESVAAVPGTALSSLLRSVLEDAGADESTVLLLDVPGQEGALLDSLRDELGALAAVIVRRCALPLPEAPDWPTVQEQMRERSFELVGHEVDGEPLWPVAVFRFDRRRHEAAMLRAEGDALKAGIARLQGDLVAVSACGNKIESLEREKGTAEKTIQTLSAELHCLKQQAAERLRTEQELKSELHEAKGQFEKRDTEPVSQTAQIRHELQALAAQVLGQGEQLIKLRKHLDWTIKKELLNTTKQIESFFAVQHALAGGELLPSLHGWPVSSDLAAFLIESIRSNDYQAVVEFGSGSSTVVIAKTLTQLGHRRDGSAEIPYIVFEHIEDYCRDTLTRLQGRGLESAVSVHLSPLRLWTAIDGQQFQYYDCETLLHEWAEQSHIAGKRVLAFVDGPPGATGKHARFPALPILMSALKGATVDILLDDYGRDEEKQVVEMWCADLRAAGIEPSLKVVDLEKQAALLRFTNCAPTCVTDAGRPLA